ncbi:uncharacterized protein TNCV_4940621 [Trichonephila clavipes]|nr:uncharacterized protein TNCV_4940621 [Trichonephila clavipes]
MGRDQCWWWRMLELLPNEIPYVLKKETDLVIWQAKVTCQHSVDSLCHCGTKQLEFLPQTQYDAPQPYTEYDDLPPQQCHVAARNPIFLRQNYPLATVQNNYAQWIHSGQVFLQYLWKKIHVLVALTEFELMSSFRCSRIHILHNITQTAPIIKHKNFKASVNHSKSWDRLDDSPRKNLTLGTCPGKMANIQTSNSLSSLTSTFPRRVPAALLAAISGRLGPDVHPADTIVVEMSAENIASKMRGAFTMQELQAIVWRYEEQLGRKVKPIPLESVLDPDDDGPITFEMGKREMFSSYLLAN